MSKSPLAPIGVEAALHAEQDPSFAPRATLFKEFSLTNRVGIVSGGNRGLGLEMALALCEAGAVVYCLDLPSEPGKEWNAAKKYVERMGVDGARLEYRSVDVTKQRDVWAVADEVAGKEGRMDVCVAAAGILDGYDCLEYPAEAFEKASVIAVNMTEKELNNLHRADHERQREWCPLHRSGRRETHGEVRDTGEYYLDCFDEWEHHEQGNEFPSHYRHVRLRDLLRVGSQLGWVQHEQVCGVADGTEHGVRTGPEEDQSQFTLTRTHLHEVSKLTSPVGDSTYTANGDSMTAAFLDKQPELYEKWSNLNPLGRIGRPDELRGVVAWLASDASTFCTGSE
jgi:NAD(P)-dependent dehydrogenase (short-subunit alcohol dehydrogenase family)